MSTLSLFSPLDVAITDPGEVDAIGGKVEFHPTRERAILEALIVGMRDAGHEPLPWHGTVREAAAGEGTLVEHVEALVPSTTRRWHLYELKKSLALTCATRIGPFAERVDSFDIGDFLAAAAADKVERVDLAITNPGFSRAREWAAAELPSATHLALHVPLSTLETQSRSVFFRDHPCDLYPIPWRPNYDGRGGFNAAVCWLVWGPGRGGRWWPLRKPESA